MRGKVLVLRPRPGADETAERARALGLDSVVSPLFEVRPLDWEAPDPARFDAVMMTSANAARHGGAGLLGFRHLPCYAVGEATAAAARAAGFRDVRTGPEDGAALLDMMAEDGIAAAFHPCGRDRTDLDHPRVKLEPVPVYASEAVAALPAAATQALSDRALVLLHSPRAAATFAGLVEDGAKGSTAICAISPAAAAAAGGGWRSVAVAPRPRDEALLALAAKLCQTPPQ